jgi:hypothetical protein
MKEKRTLWQMLTQKEAPEEFKHYNPLHAKLGSAAVIDLADYTGLNFFIRGLHEFTREINGDKFQFVDYELVARPVEGDDVIVRLRLNPTDGKTDLSHHTLLMSYYDSLQYDKGFHDIVKDNQEFNINSDDGEEKYWRVGGVKDTQKCKVAIITEGNVKEMKMDYWDFSRMTQDEAKQEFEQFLFVEMDKDSGQFEMWRGQMIDPHRITII